MKVSLTEGASPSESDLSKYLPKHLRPWIFNRYKKFATSLWREESPTIIETRLNRFFFGTHNDALFSMFSKHNFRDGHYKYYFLIIGGSLVENLATVDSPMITAIEEETRRLHKNIKMLSKFIETLNLDDLTESRKFYSSRDGRAKIFIAEAIFGPVENWEQNLLGFLNHFTSARIRLEYFIKNDVPDLKKLASTQSRKARSISYPRIRLIEAILKWPQTNKVPTKYWTNLVNNIFQEMKVLGDEDFRSHTQSIKKRRTKSI